MQSTYLAEQNKTNVLASAITLMNFALDLPRLYEIGLQIHQSDLTEPDKEVLRGRWLHRRRQIVAGDFFPNEPDEGDGNWKEEVTVAGRPLPVKNRRGGRATPEESGGYEADGGTGDIVPGWKS